MTEVNVAQEVLAAGQKRARDFAALLGIEHPVLNAPMPVVKRVGWAFFHQPDERRTN